jgi:hypothetical protein
VDGELDLVEPASKRARWSLGRNMAARMRWYLAARDPDRLDDSQDRGYEDTTHDNTIRTVRPVKCVTRKLAARNNRPSAINSG